ncbi:hypothetical protein Vi05172_g11505 [Venturia inaequalis]|nr:hypothetical protein Vi05172_g11505 [Venturia inaequalis]
MTIVNVHDISIKTTNVIFDPEALGRDYVTEVTSLQYSIERFPEHHIEKIKTLSNN